MNARVVLLLLAMCCGNARAEATLLQTRFDVLVTSLDGAAPAERVAFAEAALAELIAAYETELARSAGGAAPGADQVWRRGTAGYVARLHALRDHLRAGPTVDLVREAHGTVRLILGEEQVMLSAPRASAQRTLEASIADALCSRRDCAATAATVDEVVVARERQMLGEWALADKAPPMYSQQDGLHCVFEDMRHLRLKQVACEAVTRELRLLEESLRAVLQHGGQVDWATLRVGPAPGAGGTVGGTRVSYGANGRYFELDLPHLAAAPAVVQGAIPWLQTRLRGQHATYVIATPERLAYRVSDTD